jgi:hypothetical protein
MAVGSLPISSNRAHASRAIPPEAFGIRLKPFDLVCMAENIPQPWTRIAAPEARYGVRSQDFAPIYTGRERS